jgi:hypothetical protein
VQGAILLQTGRRVRYSGYPNLYKSCVLCPHAYLRVPDHDDPHLLPFCGYLLWRSTGLNVTAGAHRGAIVVIIGRIRRISCHLQINLMRCDAAWLLFDYFGDSTSSCITSQAKSKRLLLGDALCGVDQNNRASRVLQCKPESSRSCCSAPNCTRVHLKFQKLNLHTTRRKLATVYALFRRRTRYFNILPICLQLLLTRIKASQLRTLPDKGF